MESKSNKKPATDFVVRLVGPGIRPWAVGARNLAKVLEAVQRLVDQSDSDGDDKEESRNAAAELRPPKVALRLLNVTISSAAYQVSSSSPEIALRWLKGAGSDIDDPEHAEWTKATLSSLEELSDVARSQGCEIEIRKPNKGRELGDVLARIGPTTFHSISSSAFVTGPTSVYATVLRAGGANDMRCGIRVPDQSRMVFCTVTSEELVRELGQYIYQDVVLHGEAIWYRHSMHLKSLVIVSIEPPKAGSLTDSLRDIYDAGGSAWAKVKNPSRYLAESRGA